MTLAPIPEDPKERRDWYARHRKAARHELSKAQIGTCEFLPARQLTHDEVLWVLRSVIMGAPNQTFQVTTKWAKDLWDNDEQLRRLFRNDDDAFLKALYRQRKSVPTGDDEGLRRVLAARARAHLGLLETDSDRVMHVLQQRYTCLSLCVERLIDLAEGRSTTLRPSIDPSLQTPPFWAGKGGEPPAPAVIAKSIMALLQAEDGDRLIQVHGEPFSAKREILKSIIQELDGQHLETTDYDRIPALALAAAGLTPEAFIDEAFRFYAAHTTSTAEALGANLDLDGKIAFIHARAAEEPALILVADVDPFDDDPMIRRLRGDRIGEVLAAIIANKHPDTRVVLGVSSDEDKMAQLGPFKSFPVEASDDEFIAAVLALPADLTERFQIYTRLAGGQAKRRKALVMRLAIPALEARDDKGDLKTPPENIARALKADDAGLIFSCLWEHTYAIEDRICLGIIASSLDGVLASTFVKVVAALRYMDWPAPTATALRYLDSDPKAMRAWIARHSSLVRARDHTDPERAEFYFREPIRKLVIAAWLRSYPREARDAVWCIAREATHQARNQYLSDSGDAAEISLARNLQALTSLIASIDPEALRTDERAAPDDPTLIEYEVLPPLTHASVRRPPPRLAYVYAWSHLLQLDIDAGRQPRGDRGSDPDTRLAALLVFFLLDQPWREGPSIAAALPNDDICPAALCLEPADQLRLLTYTAKAAFRAGRFAIVLDCLRRGAALEGAPGVELSRLVRLARLRLALGLLHGGNPIVKNTALATRYDTEKVGDKLGWVIDQGDALIKKLKDAGNTDRISRGKVLMRLGEVQLARGLMDEARAAFDEALALERADTRKLSSEHLPILAGRGVRAYCRFLMAHDPATPFRNVKLPSGRIWPMEPPIADETTRDLIRALLEFNKRRVGRGRNNDRLAVRIDDARFALRTGNGEAAAERIEEATQLAQRNGAALEMLFELAELRASVAFENAMQYITARNDFRGVDDVYGAVASLNHLANEVQLAPVTAYVAFHSGQLQLLLAERSVRNSTEQVAYYTKARGHLSRADTALKTSGFGLLAPRLAAMRNALDSQRK